MTAGQGALRTWKQTCGRPGSSKTWSVGMRSRMLRPSLTDAACRARASASSAVIAIAAAGGGMPPYMQRQVPCGRGLPQA